MISFEFQESKATHPGITQCSGLITLLINTKPRIMFLSFLVNHHNIKPENVDKELSS